MLWIINLPVTFKFYDRSSHFIFKNDIKIDYCERKVCYVVRKTETTRACVASA